MVRPLQYLPPTDNMTHWMSEIRTRYRWLLRMGGEKIWLLKRKWVGDVCPVCWDTIRNAARKSEKCESCFGTGFVGGYYKPIQIIASLISGGSSERVVIYEYGMRREYPMRSWTLWTPRLRNKDIIVRSNGQRHWLQNVTPTRWRGVFLRQGFELAEVETNNIIYQVPVR